MKKGDAPVIVSYCVHPILHPFSHLLRTDNWRPQTADRQPQTSDRKPQTANSSLQTAFSRLLNPLSERPVSKKNECRWQEKIDSHL